MKHQNTHCPYCHVTPIYGGNDPESVDWQYRTWNYVSADGRHIGTWGSHVCPSCAKLITENPMALLERQTCPQCGVTPMPDYAEGAGWLFLDWKLYDRRDGKLVGSQGKMICPDCVRKLLSGVKGSIPCQTTG